MIYGSICSGIEAATVAWHPLGWRPAFFSEIDAFPRAMLARINIRVPKQVMAAIDVVRTQRLDGADQAQVIRELLVSALIDKGALRSS